MNNIMKLIGKQRNQTAIWMQNYFTLTQFYKDDNYNFFS